MFGGHMYIITSPDLIYSLQRQPKALSFCCFEAQYSARLGGMSKETEEGFYEGIASDAGNNQIIEGLKATKSDMTPQGGMDDMLATCVAVMMRTLEEMDWKGTQRVVLYDWIEREVTMATTDAVYGPSNLYRDPKAAAGFWAFTDVSMMVSLPGILPKLLAAKGWKGREELARAFSRYFASGLPSDAGQLTKARYNSMVGHVSEGDIARSECVNGLAILANSAPTAFWAVYHAFSDFELLEKIRTQVSEVTSIKPATEHQSQRRSIRLSKLKEVPLLSALVQETTRYRARGTGPRMAMEDAFLSDSNRKYHIEKIAVVMLAHNAMHIDKDVWGDTADQFNVERFIPANKIPTNSFRGFGGGVNVCPGKNFAIAEVAALLAMLAARFDVKPVSGEWTEPGQNMSNMARESTAPIKKTWVDIVLRPGMENVEWRCEM